MYCTRFMGMKDAISSKKDSLNVYKNVFSYLVSRLTTLFVSQNYNRLYIYIEALYIYTYVHGVCNQRVTSN